MSSKPLAISVRDVSKRYRLGQAAKETLMGEAIMSRLKNPFRKASFKEFDALNGVSFDVYKGDVVGVIGRNGAGKSTLLKVLSRITEPTTGEIQLYGRTGALLEVGTGFHPELTGRENIFLNGAILGMNRAEIRSQFDAIVDFAEVEKFLDTPVKRYSSGMYVRLAFAVASFLNPEILIVDEVLAVGDAEFQKKCLGKMHDVAGQGRTVLFVSHNMAAVQGLCNRGIVMQKGQLVFDGDVDKAVSIYRNAAPTAGGGDVPGDYRFENRENSYSPGKLFIRRVRTLDARGEITDAASMGEPMRVLIDVEGLTDVRGAQVAVIVKNDLGQWLANFNTGMKPPAQPLGKDGAETLELLIPTVPFVTGNYFIDISVAQKGVGRLDAIESAVPLHVTDNDVYGTGYGPRQGDGVVYLDAEWSVRPTADSVAGTA
jgi:lipopolysaccharide transport system ATP-binding protein